jgi:hypothetical protein
MKTQQGMNIKEISNDIKNTIPSWANKTLEEYSSLYNRIVLLTMEVDRLIQNEQISTETNEKFNDWTLEFFKNNNIEHLFKSYDEFIINKVDEEEL